MFLGQSHRIRIHILRETKEADPHSPNRKTGLDLRKRTLDGGKGKDRAISQKRDPKKKHGARQATRGEHARPNTVEKRKTHKLSNYGRKEKEVQKCSHSPCFMVKKLPRVSRGVKKKDEGSRRGQGWGHKKSKKERAGRQQTSRPSRLGAKNQGGEKKIT